MTGNQRYVLRLVADGQPYAGTRDSNRGHRWRTLDSLRVAGLVTTTGGAWRLTDAGKAAL